MMSSLKSGCSALLESTFPWFRNVQTNAQIDEKMERIDLAFNAIWKHHKRVHRSSQELAAYLETFRSRWTGSPEQYKRFEELEEMALKVSDQFQFSRKLRSRLNRLIYKTRYLLLEAQAEQSVKQEAVKALLQEVRSIEVSVSETTKFLEITNLNFRKLVESSRATYQVSLALAQSQAGFLKEGREYFLRTLFGANANPEQRVAAAGKLTLLGNLDGELDLLQLTCDFNLKSPTTFRGKSSEATAWLVGMQGQEFRQIRDRLFDIVHVATASKSIDSYLAASSLVATSLREVMPELGDEIQMEWISRSLSISGLEPIQLSPFSAGTKFDRLECRVEDDAFISNTELVTVLVPARNASNWIETALKSLCNQTWRSLQIIVIDDKSQDNTAALARQMAREDSRIEVVSLNKHKGAYGARNVGLDKARGDFITVHDADDWSHPRKIELQVKSLLATPHAVANLSQSARVEPQDLEFQSFFGKEILRQNSSSLLFRREVFEELGYWDEVPFGADTEYHHRIIAAYGKESAPVLGLGVLSFTRFHKGSLSGGGAGSMQFGMSNARATYFRRFTEWHEENEGNRKALRLGKETKKRPFEVPVVMRKQAESPKFLDALFVGNFSAESKYANDLCSWLDQVSEGATLVGIRHTPEPKDPLSEVSPNLRNRDSGVVHFERNECPPASVVIVTVESLKNATGLDAFDFSGNLWVVDSSQTMTSAQKSELAGVFKPYADSVSWVTSIEAGLEALATNK